MLFQLISRARRRLFWNALASEAAGAATFLAGLLILLLLLGTDVLGWQWLILVPAAAFSHGAYSVVRRLPGSYRTAQIVDERLRLADTLSTALFFSTPAPAQHSADSMRWTQYERALHASRSVRAADAIPFRTPRMVYALAPLAFVAGGLFVLRYAWQDHLDLRQPAPLIGEYLLKLSKTELAELFDRKKQAKNHDSPDRQQSADLGHSMADPNHASSAAPQDPASAREEAAARGSQSKPSGTPQEEQNSASRPRSNASPEGGRQDSEGQQAQQSDSGSGLLSKISDAVRNVLSRMSPKAAGSAAAGQAADARDFNSRSGGGQRQASQPGSPQPGGQPGSSQGTGQRQSQRQATVATGSGKNSDGTDKQSASSAGSQEGAKELRESEQLAAMGKISVILGKRSENVSGTAAVETVSGEQTLATPYAAARAAHIQGGALIERDEVPVAVQDYVERYLVAVRNHPGKGAPHPAK